ncbi:anti-sigma factor domain-containing protein [Demequina flava]|uniref:anti-sigma factor n=1 Tax=Demequina flava TaxID=1095025 RepID=UPI00078342D6|nr:anti-sigma factor [Demequina flava]
MNDNIHSLAAPYAVDALTELERTAFEAHLTSCEDCQEEVVSLAGAVEELALGEETAPPLSLKGSVMDEVRRTSQLPPIVESGVAETGAAGPRTHDSDTEVLKANSGDDLSARRHRRARRGWAVSAVAAASAVVLTLAGVAWMDVRSDRESELAIEKDVMMVASAPDANSMDLELGKGHVVTSERMDSLAVMGTSAPMPEDGMEYQLWLVMADGSKMAGPTFMPHDGEYMAVAEGAMGDVAAVAVTMEPPGGSQEPTSDPVCVTNMPTKA